MLRFTIIRTIAGWMLAAAALAAGSYVLFDFWRGFNQFAVNRSSGLGWEFEVMFWYALPGFEAGVLIGLLPWAASRGMGRLLRVLNLGVWAENAVNFGIIFFLVSQGMLF